MAREQILITVKTYPVISKKYGELVCTAGIRADGSWVRLYPVPFRLLDYPKRYKKFDWIETDLAKSRKDRRPESYHPRDEIEVVVMWMRRTSGESDGDWCLASARCTTGSRRFWMVQRKTACLWPYSSRPKSSV